MNILAKLILQKNYTEAERYLDNPGLIDTAIRIFGQQLQLFRKLTQSQITAAERDLHWLSGEDGDWQLTSAAYAVLVAAMLGQKGSNNYYADYVSRMAETVMLEKDGVLSYCGSRILGGAPACQAGGILARNAGGMAEKIS